MPQNLRQFPEVPKLIGYLVAPAALSADNTPAALDISGYTNVKVIVGVGVAGVTLSETDKIEIKLRHGGSTVGGHTAVASADVVMGEGETLGSNGIIRGLTAPHAAASLRQVDYVGDQQYLSSLADFDGTHGAATPLFVAVMGFRGRTNPPV